MSAIEAAAAGKPIVLTSDCGIASEFASAGAAQIVEPTVESVLRGMLAIADNTRLRKELGERARRLFERKWSTNLLERNLVERYSEVRSIVAGA